MQISKLQKCIAQYSAISPCRGACGYWQKYLKFTNIYYMNAEEAVTVLAVMYTSGIVL